MLWEIPSGNIPEKASQSPLNLNSLENVTCQPGKLKMQSLAQ